MNNNIKHCIHKTIQYIILSLSTRSNLVRSFCDYHHCHQMSRHFQCIWQECWSACNKGQITADFNLLHWDWLECFPPVICDLKLVGPVIIRSHATQSWNLESLLIRFFSLNFTSIHENTIQPNVWLESSYFQSTYCVLPSGCVQPPQIYQTVSDEDVCGFQYSTIQQYSLSKMLLTTATSNLFQANIIFDQVQHLFHFCLLVMLYLQIILPIFPIVWSAKRRMDVTIGIDSSFALFVVFRNAFLSGLQCTHKSGEFSYIDDL